MASKPTGGPWLRSSSWGYFSRLYRAGYRYSCFCDLYRLWERRLSVTMRQARGAVEKLFVDYAGDKMPVMIDRLTETREAWIFVAVLGASNFTYAEATWTQALVDWIRANTRAFETIGGVPRLVVPHNATTVVTKPVSTNRRSTGPIPTWRRIATPPSARLHLNRGSAPHTALAHRSEL